MFSLFDSAGWIVRLMLACAVIGTGLARPGLAQVPGGEAPLLRIEAGGPVSTVTSLAFSPGGEILYAAGWDKLVHVWRLDNDGQFRYDPTAAYRIPIGGGLDGAISAMAISDDGQWLAVGGRSAKRGVAGQREHGTVFPGASLSREQWLDEGVIYVFNTRTRQVRTLRGHQGSVVSLKFAPPAPGKPPALISAASTRREGDLSAELIAWDVQATTELRKTATYPQRDDGGNVAWEPLPAINATFVPRFAAWRTGEGPAEVHVAMTWGKPEFGLRVWDIDSGRMTLPRPSDGTQSDSLMYLLTADWQRKPASAGERGFLTAVGNGRSNRVELDAWTPPAGAIRNLVRGQDAKSLLALPAGELAITAQSLPDSGQPIVVVGDPQQQRSSLLVLGSDGRTVQSRHRLWDGTFVSHIAASDTGRHVVLAHDGTSEILLFSAVDLLGQNAVPQRLRTGGETFESVTFVQNEEQVGVKLTGSDPQQGIVFDITTARVSPAGEEWTADEPAADWQVTAAPAGEEATELTLNVTSPEGQTSTVTVAGSDDEALPVLSAAVVCTAGEHVPVPLLIVAFHQRLQPELRVYHLEDGAWIGRFTGHTGEISGLAVSGDGRLVASIARDRSVRLWQLADLAEELGDHGLIRKDNNLLELVDRDGGIFAANSVGGIAEDTQILSVSQSGETRPFRTPWEVYEYAYVRSPGTTLSLDVIDPAGASGAVDVALGQAIDDRKALFSLFLIPPAEGDDWQWIGWSPLGPFDSSGPDAEQYLGWHFNTGDPQTPTRFADVGEYREDFHTPGLLEHLYATGTLPERQALAPPRMLLMIAGAEDKQVIDPDRSERIVLRNGNVCAILKTSGRFPQRLIDEVSGLLTTSDGGQREVASESTGENEWTFDLSDVPWSRGFHRLDVRITTRELTPRTFDEQITMRFQPPPPQVRIEPIPSPARDEEVALQVQVTPAAGTPAHVLIEHVVVDEAHFALRQIADPYEEQIEQPQALTRKLTLQPGFNRVTVVAVNEGATYGFEGLETARESIDVQFTPTQDPVNPTITLTDVLTGANASPITLKEQTDEVEVDVERVRLRGTIGCDDELDRAAIRFGDVSEEITLAAARSDQPQTFEQEISLSPGENVVVVSADSKSKGHAERRVRITYVPQLPAIAGIVVEPLGRDDAPEVAIADTEPDQHRLRLYDLLHEPAVRVRAEITPDAAGHPFEVTMLVDGEPATESTLAVQDGRLDGTVTIPPGRHHLQLRLSNQWQRARHPWENTVAYLRPPRILQVQAAGDLDTPRLEGVILEARSPAERPLMADRTRITLNGSLVPVKATAKAGEKGLWTVSLDPIPLDQQGQNELTFSLANVDGPALQPAAHRVTVAAPPEPKPTLTILGPGSTLQTSQAELEFRVASDSPLSDVAIRQITQGGRSIRDDLSPVSVESNLSHFRVPVQLQPGPNRFEVQASNAGGPVRQMHTVSFTPPPIVLHVDQLGPLTPERVNERMQFSSALESSSATLTGHVQFPSDENPPQVAQFWVNGFMQRAVRLQPVEGSRNRRTFEVNLFFNRQKRNHVVVNLPGVAVDKSSEPLRSFTVDCREPRTIQELHLLVIGAAGPDTDGLDPAQREAQWDSYAAELENRALAALQARTGNDDRLIAPSFARIHRTVLTGKRAVYRLINTKLIQLGQQIRPRSSRSEQASNSVLIIYYHGKEVRVDDPRGDRFVLATTENWDDPTANMNEAITNEHLTTLLGRFFGAHLLFLDVQTPSFEDRDRWPVDPYLGVVRIATPVPPEDSYPLMSALQDVLPSRKILDDVRQGIQDHFTEKSSLSDISIPAILSDLEIGGAP